MSLLAPPQAQGVEAGSGALAAHTLADAGTLCVLFFSQLHNMADFERGIVPDEKGKADYCCCSI